jgi:cytoskeletal protein CcmA (bactofilin family)
MARTARAGVSGDGREAIIGRTTRVRGRVSGDGDLLIEGNVEGDIAVGGDLTIAEGGRATSSIEAGAVTLRGELEGNVQARGVVRIEASARVRGDIQGESVALEEGAEFTGRLDAAFELPAELGGSSGGDARGRRR